MKMWAVYVIVLLLPAIVYSRISIRITPGRTEAESSVSFSGSDTSLISERERRTFGLDEASLNNAVYAYKGNRCTDVFVNPPTKFGDVYSKYNWDLVERTLRPVSARIIGLVTKPVVVGTAEYVNKHNTISTAYSTSVTQNVEETASHTWKKSGELTISQEISYSVSVGAASVGGLTNLQYTSGWSEDNTESRTVSLGTTSSVLATVPPNETVVATLTASQGSMQVEIKYQATLNNGDIFCNYEGKYQGHHFWAYPIYRLQKAANLTKVVTSTEIISIGFYSNARIEITDGSKHEEKPAGVIDSGDETKG